MYLRRRVLAAGAVTAAAAGVLLGASPAQAGCTADETAGWEAARWQVGAQLGPAPFSLTGAGGVPALVLSALPESRVAVRGAGGQNLVRIDAAGASALADAAAVPRTPDLREHLHVARPSAHVRLAPSARVRTLDTATHAVADRPARAARPAAPAAAPAQVEVLQAGGGESALGGAFTWVPIEGVAGMGAGDDGAGWATGIGLVVLAGTAAAVTVARRGRMSAG